MASKRSGRYWPRHDLLKHTKLHTQQRRLRHLSCIIGRNIDPNLIPTTRQTSKCLLLQTFYTIHPTDDENIVLYKSEIIENTVNPNWKAFDSNVFSKHPGYKRESSVKICVWASRKSQAFQMILSYQICFSGLVYKREHLRLGDGIYERNSLLFRLFDGYYVLPNVAQRENHAMFNHMKVISEQVSVSYKKASLMRANDTVKAIDQTRQQVSEVRRQMEQYLSKYERRRRKRKKLESVKFRTQLLKNELNSLKEKLKADKEINMTQRKALVTKANDLKTYHEDLERCLSDMKVSHSGHIARRETLLKVAAHLSFRRRQLAAELSYIYPIIEAVPGKDKLAKRDLAICGVRLPNSEDFIGEDESMLAVALGNVAHLVYMMAKFMELPLRYPLSLMGSRSTILDNVTDKLTDKEREFPLYLKGKERFHFNYGVFLLNKNIAQLRYHNGLGTADLRNTLANLKHLLEVKYGVRIVVKQDFRVSSSARMIASRTISLPMTSSPIGTSPEKLINDVTKNSSVVKETEKLRPRSEVITSGLPSVHVAKQQQHRFIQRKSTNKKLRKATSLPESDDLSPGLIGVPFEDVIQRTIDGNLHDKVQRHHASTSSSQDDVVTDCAHDFILNKSPINKTLDNIKSTPGAFERQISEALLIPDPYDKEQDLPRSSSDSNILV